MDLTKEHIEALDKNTKAAEALGKNIDKFENMIRDFAQPFKAGLAAFCCNIERVGGIFRKDIRFPQWMKDGNCS